MLNFPGRQSTRRRGGKATPSWMAPQQQQNQQQQQKVRPFNGEIRTRAYTTSYGSSFNDPRPVSAYTSMRPGSSQKLRSSAVLPEGHKRKLTQTQPDTYGRYGGFSFKHTHSGSSSGVSSGDANFNRTGILYGGQQKLPIRTSVTSGGIRVNRTSQYHQQQQQYGGNFSFSNARHPTLTRGSSSQGSREMLRASLLQEHKRQQPQPFHTHEREEQSSSVAEWGFTHTTASSSQAMHKQKLKRDKSSSKHSLAATSGYQSALQQDVAQFKSARLRSYSEGRGPEGGDIASANATATNNSRAVARNPIGRSRTLGHGPLLERKESAGKLRSSLRSNQRNQDAARAMARSASSPSRDPLNESTTLNSNALASAAQNVRRGGGGSRPISGQPKPKRGPALSSSFSSCRYAPASSSSSSSSSSQENKLRGKAGGGNSKASRGNSLAIPGHNRNQQHLRRMASASSSYYSSLSSLSRSSSARSVALETDYFVNSGPATTRDKVLINRPLPSTAPHALGDRPSGDICEVGMAENANPKWRSTMEDKMIVQFGLEPSEGLPSTGKASHTTREGRYSRSVMLNGVTEAYTAHNTAKAAHGYFAVYDGHGGIDCVNFVEEQLHGRVQAGLKQGLTPKQAFRSAFLAVDESMAKHFKFQECGTTVAAALIRPRDARGNRLLHVANVGDSRVVLSDNGKAVRLTKDHNLKLTSEVHRVRQEGGVVFNGRVNGQLAVSRALGDHSLKSSGVSAVPDQMHVVLQPRHRLLIIACDGLWDVVTDQQAVQALELLHDERDAVEMAKVLVDMAIQRGTTDNVSVMVVLLRQ